MDATPHETLGQRIGRLREAACLTQEQLAELAGTPVWSLRNWEHDHRRPRADAMFSLARALKVPMEALLEGLLSKVARAEVRDQPVVRALKRAWERATETERRQFLKWVDDQRESNRRAETAASGSNRRKKNSR